MRDLAALGVDDFTPLVGEEFEVIGVEGGPEGLLLSAADAGRPVPGHRTSFVLLFSGPADVQLSQGLLRLGHPALGDLEIFVTPVGSRGDTVRYEAVFG